MYFNVMYCTVLCEGCVGRQHPPRHLRCRGEQRTSPLPRTLTHAASAVPVVLGSLMLTLMLTLLPQYRWYFVSQYFDWQWQSFAGHEKGGHESTAICLVVWSCVATLFVLYSSYLRHIQYVRVRHLISNGWSPHWGMARGIDREWLMPSP